jgi:hypothetical protein
MLSLLGKLFLINEGLVSLPAPLKLKLIDNTHFGTAMVCCSLADYPHLLKGFTYQTYLTPVSTHTVILRQRMFQVIQILLRNTAEDYLLS